MKALFLLLFAIIITGCGATKLTQNGSMVREIEADYSTNCEFLGVIETTEAMGWTAASQDHGALNKARNEVAARGGNAMVISSTSASGINSQVQVDGYRCPK